LAQERIAAHDLVTHKFPFEKIHDAFDVVLNRKDGVSEAAITP
jgi:threonine dehydrogenase-like Zn-dependent dehydrogenase